MIFRASYLVLCLSHSLARSSIPILNNSNRRENQQRLALCAMLLPGVGFFQAGCKALETGVGTEGLPSQTLTPAHITSVCRGWTLCWCWPHQPQTLLMFVLTGCAKCPREKAFDTENSHMGHLYMNKKAKPAVWCCSALLGGLPQVWGSLSCRTEGTGGSVWLCTFLCWCLSSWELKIRRCNHCFEWILSHWCIGVCL